MLIAARSSKDFACCLRATASACSKYAPACDEPSRGNFNAISPFMRLISASHHRSLVVSTSVIASPMQRQASSNWPSSAWALDKCAKRNGKYTLEPVNRYVVIPEVIIWIASEALPAHDDQAGRNSDPGLQGSAQPERGYSCDELQPGPYR